MRLPLLTNQRPFVRIDEHTISLPRRVVEFDRLSDETSQILHEAGLQGYQFIRQFRNPAARGCVLSGASTSDLFKAPGENFDHVIHLKRINDLRRINKFFETVNHKLAPGGVFISHVEVYHKKKDKILAAYPSGLNTLIYGFYYLFTRVFPKLPLSKQLFFLTTRGHNRVLSSTETLGRLYSCGFEVTGETFINGYHYFACRKVKEPAYDTHPTFGMIIRLKRIGKNGELINVYKLRTMHAYAEYLQPYIYRKCKLADGGKFKDDFRVTTVGRFLRKFWIDELPMLVNVFIKRNLKIVGVRPLSEHYFNLYSEELKAKRIRYKPGLIPPFYAQCPTPKTLDEIQQNEMEYLNAYEQHPMMTDLKYFFKALYNILFHHARSK